MLRTHPTFQSCFSSKEVAILATQMRIIMAQILRGRATWLWYLSITGLVLLDSFGMEITEKSRNKEIVMLGQEINSRLCNWSRDPTPCLSASTGRSAQQPCTCGMGTRQLWFPILMGPLPSTWNTKISYLDKICVTNYELLDLMPWATFSTWLAVTGHMRE